MSIAGSKDEFVGVPPPLQKYNGDEIRHEDNERILELNKNPSLLPKRRVKQLKQKLTEINERLAEAETDFLLTAYEQKRQRYNSLKLNHDALKRVWQELEQVYCNEPDYHLVAAIAAFRLLRAIRQNRRAGAVVAREVKSLRTRLEPFRRDIAIRQRIQQQLKSHRAAVEDQKQERVLQEQMSQEAHLVEEQLIATLSRLGFKHTYTEGRTTKTDRVQFDHIIATADQLQFKLRASRRGMFGGTYDLLPQGVYVGDIVQDRVMRELSVSLEREVWSPHTADEQIPFVNGAWIIVERLGLVEGIPRHVTYRQLMARYETADHKRIPIPAGLKRGRIVNWIHVDSPSGIHFMFTGISGSGKSNAMRAMVSAVIEKQDPADVNFVFVDLKRQGDFREFGDAPHCIRVDDRSVLEEIEDVVSVLQRVRAEMHMRQQKIGRIAKNLEEYNSRIEPAHRMPRICIVFDEYANTRRTRFSQQADIIDDICIEIGQVGRAAGISLWIGIQQPRRDNMPSPLRDNITTQFVGHQANVGAAQSVTGNRDSLKIEDIPGRMMSFVGWKSFPVQMPFIPDDDVRQAVKIAREKFGDENPYQLLELDEAEDYQPLSDEEIVLETALSEFGGDLKAYPIYQQLKETNTRNLSRSAVTNIIYAFAEQEAIVYRGLEYSIEKQPGNYYRMIPVDS